MKQTLAKRCPTPTPIITCALLLAACGGAPGTDPEDMSAEEHRTAAGSHDEQSGHHDAQYDPNAVALRDRSATSGDLADVQDTYNPTSAHLAAAEEHADIAEQHRHAAAALEAFEEEQCGAFSDEIRALCPLLGQLAAVNDTEGGIRLRFREGVDTAAAHAHVECHVAFARTQGREGMEHCPMYVPGVRVERDEAGSTLLLTNDQASVAVIRQRAQAHVTAGE